ncbi:MAG TPA: ATP-binding protein [Longimicrobium sp.]|nr:ATP-binding protein [Longimicrobium sp.]
MLIRFRVENFRSIREEQELSMVASALTEHPETLVPAGSGVRLLRAAAVYGPNASGKSSLFHALSFMREAVADSHRSWSPYGGVPRTPFALDRSSQTEPSLFAVDVLIGGVRYEYGFTADSTRVHEEWLYAYPRGRKQEWFTRDASRDVEFAFSRSLPGENRAISALTRPNSLFLSAAAQNNHEQLLRVYRWFAQNLWIVDDSTRSYFENYAVEWCRSEPGRQSLLASLVSADLGVTDIEFVESGLVPETQEVFGLPSGPRAVDPTNLFFQPPRVRLWHSGGGSGPSVALPFEQESRGTRTLFGLLGILAWCLKSGGTLVVDELDQSLHSHLARQIVTWFTSPVANPQAAQLLFNTHDTNLLSEDLLRRDQVWFTEKTFDGATRLFPLTDFQARKNENLERGYLQGRYGALPSLSDGFGVAHG